MVTYVNRCPHDIKLFQEGKTITIPISGMVTFASSLKFLKKWPDTVYIVSFKCKEQLKQQGFNRTDVVAPYHRIYKKGKVIACRNLV